MPLPLLFVSCFLLSYSALNPALPLKIICQVHVTKKMVEFPSTIIWEAMFMLEFIREPTLPLHPIYEWYPGTGTTYWVGMPKGTITVVFSYSGTDPICTRYININNNLSFNYNVVRDCNGTYTVNISNVTNGTATYRYYVGPPGCLGLISNPGGVASLSTFASATSNSRNYTFYGIEREICYGTPQDLVIRGLV